MTLLSLKKFAGEIPRVPAHDLPDSNAATAINCNFAYGELRPLKGGFEMKTLANAARSIFTLDGLTFYSWTAKTKAWKGPVVNDTFKRMYYANAVDGFRIAYTDGMPLDGGPPSTSYKVGVPRPTAALTYRLIDRDQLPDYPNAVVKLTSFFEADGKRYNEREITNFVTDRAFRKFRFSVDAPSTPAGSVENSVSNYAVSSFSYLTDGGQGVMVSATVYVDGGTVTIRNSSQLVYNGVTYDNVTSITPVSGTETSPGAVLASDALQSGVGVPETATLSVRVTVSDATKNTTVFSLSASSSVASPRSDAVPGGVTATLTKDGDTPNAWVLTLEYGAVEARAYVATIVNNHLEESQPSDPIIVSPTYMQSVEITMTPPVLTGYVPASKCRFYRTVGTTYLSCTSDPVTLSSPTVFVDSKLTLTESDATLETQTWGLPPTNLRHLTLLPNGFFVGSVGDTLYMSEPYAPWAWPYSTTFPHQIIGIRAAESGCVVTTTAYPYLFTGVHPSAMTQMVLSSAQAGISDSGMCTIGNAVAFVGHDGVVLVDGSRVDVEAFLKLFTREVWRERYGAVLSTMELAYHDGALVGASPTAGKCFELRLDENAGGFTQYDSSFRIDGMFVLPATDQLYYTNGSKLYQYRGGSDMSYTWRSKDWILPKPVNFGAGFINLVNGTCKLTLFADGAVWHTVTFAVLADGTRTVKVGSGAAVTMPVPGYFRIPSGRKALRWSFQLEGTGIVRELSLADQMAELKKV